MQSVDLSVEEIRVLRLLVAHVIANLSVVDASRRRQGREPQFAERLAARRALLEKLKVAEGATK